MKFQLKDLKKLLHSVKKNHVNEINIYSNNFKLTINKTKVIPSVKEKYHKKLNPSTTVTTILNANDKTLYNKKIQNNNIENYSTIVSPMVGTFYRSPAPNEPTFINLYDIVQKKQTVCIIEAMKLMNEIESEVNGEVVEILVQDGDIIDCGQALMRVKPIIE